MLRRRRFLQGLGAVTAAPLASPLLSGCTGAKPAAAPSPSAPVADQPGTIRRFPTGFRWGAATSAYQVEGAARTDGRGASVWDTFSHTTGRTRNGATGDVAADHYARFAQDVELMAGLGLTSYRFSISWSRVLPTGAGTVNQKGLDFYKRLVDALNARGIAPMATLWHWDTPQALEDKGGWTSRDTASRFADYADVVYRALGADVPVYLTLNEPKTVVQLGYLAGVHAPGRRDPAAAGAALHHLLLGHGLAVQALRATGLRSTIGPALNLHPCYPADDTTQALAASDAQDVRENTLYLDPICRGTYPKQVLEAGVFGAALRKAQRPGDLKIISSPVDVLGVNYYTPIFVDASGEQPQKKPLASPANWEQIYPEGIYDLLVRLRRDYGDALELHITENGRPTDTVRSSDGSYRDDQRITFLHDHLVQAHRAISHGANLRSYQAWSLLDNFEWAEGYDQRWGMVFVDFATQRRTPKKSAAWYSAVIAANGL